MMMPAVVVGIMESAGTCALLQVFLGLTSEPVNFNIFPWGEASKIPSTFGNFGVGQACLCCTTVRAQERQNC